MHLIGDNSTVGNNHRSSNFFMTVADNGVE